MPVVVDLRNDLCDASAAARHGRGPGVPAEAAGAAAGVVEAGRAAGVEVVFVRFLGGAGHQGVRRRRRE